MAVLPLLLYVALFAAAANAQSGDLPVPAGYEENLRRRGYMEAFLPPGPGGLEPVQAELDSGWIVYHRDRNFELLPNSRPAPGERAEVLRITATAGEIESQPLALYALRDSEITAEAAVSEAARESAWLAGAAKVEDVLFHAIQHPEQGGDRKRYVRYPVFVRPAAARQVPARSSRLYWVTVTVPGETRSGLYRASVVLRDSRGVRARIPLEVRVLPFRLTERGVPRFGAFLSNQAFAPGEWAMMKRYGLDALQWFWGSHAIRILNQNGQVRMDFTEYDAFVNGMKAAGMRGPLVLSLGNSWLGHYELKLAEAFGLRLMKRELEGQTVTLADMTDPRWEKPYLEGLRQIFAHARDAGWPPLALLINDEPTKHIMAYHPYRYHLIKKHFPEIPVYGVFFEPDKDPGPLLHSSDIVVANRDFERMRGLATDFGKRLWTYNNVTADESFGKNRLLYGQIPSYYGSEAMFFWCWNYWIGNPWDDFDGRGGEAGGPGQPDADWVAVYPAVDGKEPVRTLALEAAREAIDDVRYLKTLEERVSQRDPARWATLRAEIRRRQAAMLAGVDLDKRIYTDQEFFLTTRNDDVEKLRDFVIAELLQ